MTHSVTVCAADVGCAECLIPVIRQLRHHTSVHVLTDAEGGAAALVQAAFGADGTEPDPLSITQTSLSDLGRRVAESLSSPKSLLLTAPAGKRQRFALRASDAARLAGANVVWLETHYHAALIGENRSFVPDHLVVADRHAAALYGNAYAAELHILGQPAFDSLADVRGRRLALRNDFRRAHALSAEQKVLAFFASSSRQVDPKEALTPICAALDQRPDVHLIAHFHPSDPRRESLTRDLERRFDRLIATSTTDAETIVCADAVAVQFSTVGVKAVYLETPTLYLWTPSVRRHMATFGAAQGNLPTVAQGAAVAVRSHAEALTQIPRLLDDSRLRNRLLARQRARFPLRREATRDIADLVLSLL